MERIVVTPAGRERYLKVLFNNLQREKKNFGFSEWHLWLNTDVPSDVDYCRQLEEKNDWVKVVEVEGRKGSSCHNIHKFFKFAGDAGKIYVRLDDDIVYLEKGFFDKLVNHRLENKHPFLIYANIINNSIISHIHQRNGLIGGPVCGYGCMDGIGWSDAGFAEMVHRQFISDLKSGDEGKWRRSFNKWVCNRYERVSINAICWFGSDMAQVSVDSDEEQCLSVSLPKELGRPNEIFGGAVAAHFAFYTQRKHMDNTEILGVYERLARPNQLE